MWRGHPLALARERKASEVRNTWAVIRRLESSADAEAAAMLPGIQGLYRELVAELDELDQEIEGQS